MVFKLSDFVAFVVFFVAFCTLLLGPHTLWVLPLGMVVTYLLAWAYVTWTGHVPSEESIKCQTSTQSEHANSCSHCQNEKQ